MTTIQECIEWGHQQLKEKYPFHYQQETKILLCKILGTDYSHILAWPEKALTDQQLKQFQDWVKTRVQGVPIAYITQEQEFWSLNLKVTPDTLIPRADTEVIVETVLNKLPISPLNILELGTGTGAISCALAKERPDWRILATDISDEALTVARYNIQNLGLKNIQTIKSDWFKMVSSQTFDAIVSNPPYVESHSKYLKTDIRFEPMLALTSGKEGLDAIQQIIVASRNYLSVGGYLFLEHGDQQAKKVVEIFEQNGFVNINCVQDYSGLDRVSYANL